MAPNTGGSTTAFDLAQDGTRRVLRFTSGLNLYEEGFDLTRLSTYYFSPIGRIETEPLLKGLLHNNSAFGLEIDGCSLHRGWEWQGVEELDSARPTQRHIALRLRHAARPVDLVVHTLLDGTPLFTRWLEITNTGTAPATLAQLWVWSGRVFPLQAGERYWGSYTKYQTAHGDYQVGYFIDNKHSTEGNFHWRPVDFPVVEIGEESGASGWGHPICYLQDRAAGNIFVAQLAWSGNWRMRIERRDTRSGNPEEQEDLLYLRAGPWAPGPMRVLLPDETIKTPEIHFGGIAGGLTEMVQSLHEHQRRSAILAPPAGSANLIINNTWSYKKHEITEDHLKAEIDTAASIGAEAIIIDAGWYGNQGEDWHITGNWKPGDRLPHGLKPIWDYARQRGLKVGLWVWIEAASLNSPIIQLHPDWLLQRDGQRLDNLLDLTNPDVAAWVEIEICRVIQEYDLDIFRLDYNVYPGEGGYARRAGFDENSLCRHYDAMYSIWERIHQRYPHLLLENCAGGGKRTDLGMVSRFHYTWISDYGLAPRAFRIHNGMLMALAPELIAHFTGISMNTHLGGDLDMQLRLCLFSGNPTVTGLWPELQLENPLAGARVRRMTDLYKSFVRPFLRTCRVYHHTPEISGNQPEGWCVLEFTSPDQRQSICGIFRLAGDVPQDYCLRLRGLSRSLRYTIQMDNSGESFEAAGRDLIEIGLTITLPFAMTSELVIVRYCD